MNPISYELIKIDKIKAGIKISLDVPLPLQFLMARGII